MLDCEKIVIIAMMSWLASVYNRVKNGLIRWTVFCLYIYDCTASYLSASWSCFCGNKWLHPPLQCLLLFNFATLWKYVNKPQGVLLSLSNSWNNSVFTGMLREAIHQGAWTAHIKSLSRSWADMAFNKQTLLVKVSCFKYCRVTVDSKKQITHAELLDLNTWQSALTITFGNNIMTCAT